MFLKCWDLLGEKCLKKEPLGRRTEHPTFFSSQFRDTWEGVWGGREVEGGVAQSQGREEEEHRQTVRQASINKQTQSHKESRRDEATETGNRRGGGEGHLPTDCG